MKNQENQDLYEACIHTYNVTKWFTANIFQQSVMHQKCIGNYAEKVSAESNISYWDGKVQIHRDLPVTDHL